MIKIGVLASGNGSTLQAIINACNEGVINGSVDVVISNNSKAYALTRARREGIDTWHISSTTCPVEDLALTYCLYNVDLVVLAGYMKKIGHSLLNSHKNRIINIHPSLLPKFSGEGMYGIKVHQAVLNAGEKETGASVHVVDNMYDHGKILRQKKVLVEENDSVHTLAARVLKAEHTLLVKTINLIEKGVICL